MINPAKPTVRQLACWIVDRESDGGSAHELRVEAAFRACEKLRHVLSVLAGIAGFRSLLLRALALARVEVPWLDAVKVNSEGLLEITGVLETQQDGGDAERGGEALLVQLLGLLAMFIGQSLTFRLVRDVWPDAPLT
jgi:hypothetical protein